MVNMNLSFSELCFEVVALLVYNICRRILYIAFIYVYNDYCILLKTKCQ